MYFDDDKDAKGFDGPLLFWIILFFRKGDDIFDSIALVDLELTGDYERSDVQKRLRDHISNYSTLGNVQVNADKGVRIKEVTGRNIFLLFLLKISLYFSNWIFTIKFACKIRLLYPTLYFLNFKTPLWSQDSKKNLWVMFIKHWYLILCF